MTSNVALKRISDSIGFRTYKLLRTHLYPLTEDVCLLSFEDSLKKLGYEVELDDASRTMTINADVFLSTINDGFNCTVTLPYASITSGNGNSSSNSIISIDQTAFSFFERMNGAIPRGIDRSKFKAYIENSFTDVSKNINFYIQSQIDERKDAILLNRLLRPSTNEYQSNLLEKVLDRYDLDYYDKALELHEGNDFPEEGMPQRLLYNPWSSFEEQNYPHPKHFEDFFWGVYLHDLYRIKMYDTVNGMSPKLVNFVKDREAILANARLIKWGELPSVARN